MLDKLLTLLAFSVVDDQLFLDTASPLPPEASKLLRAVPGRVLGLEGVRVELVGSPEAGALEIRGTLRYPWPLQESPKASLSQVALRLIIGAPDTAGTPAVRMEARGHLRMAGLSAPFTGELDPARGYWQITVGADRAPGVKLTDLLALPWGARQAAALPREGFENLRLRVVERFVFAWDPGADQAPAYPIELHARAELFKEDCHLELKGGPEDLAVEAWWAEAVCGVLQASANERLRASVADALADLREVEEFCRSFGIEAQEVTEQVGQVLALVRRNVGRLEELRRLAARNPRGGGGKEERDVVEQLKDLRGLTGPLMRLGLLDLYPELKEALQHLLKLSDEIEKLSRAAAQARLEEAQKAVPAMQARLSDLESRAISLRTHLDAADQPHPNAVALARQSVGVYRKQVQTLQDEIKEVKQALVAGLKGLGRTNPELSRALDLLQQAPALMALLGARQAAREELQAVELQLQYLQENADGPVKLPAHLTPEYAEVVVERNLLRRQLSTELALQNTLGLIVPSWPENFEALMAMVPGLVEAAKGLVEAALGDMERWNGHMAAISVALGGGDLVAVRAAGITASAGALGAAAVEMQVRFAVQGQEVGVRLLCDPRRPVESVAGKVANVALSELRALEQPAA